LVVPLESNQLQAKEGKFALLRLPSGETRLVQRSCRAHNRNRRHAEWESIVWGNAGRIRHNGRKPHVRGKAMNPNDHPHGGGEGRAPVGRRKSGPVSATGVKLSAQDAQEEQAEQQDDYSQANSK
jgi:large subunit ribosomal protein L2